MGMVIRISLAQINPTVGDLIGNKKIILKNIAQAHSLGAQIISFPELAVTGYPPEDLVLKSRFIEDNLKIMAEIAYNTPEIVAVYGFIYIRRTKGSIMLLQLHLMERSAPSTGRLSFPITGSSMKKDILSLEESLWYLHTDL